MTFERVVKGPSYSSQPDERATAESRSSVGPHRPTLLWIQSLDLSQILDAETFLVPSQLLREKGWNVILTQAAPDAATITLDNGLLNVPRRPIYLLGQILLHLQIIRWMLGRDDIDIVMFHEVSSAWLLPIPLLYRLARRRRPFVVMDARTLHMGGGARGMKDHLRSLYYRYAHRLSDLWVDGHLTITPRIAEALEIGPTRLLGVWPSGVDPGKFEAAPAARRWPIDDEPVRLVYIGSMHVERNLVPLCRAVMAAAGRGMNFTFTIVGSGDQEAELRELASASNGLVMVKPSIPHKDVWKVLADTHVGVLPFPDELKFRVSSPIKLFEYMASGMPILATRIVCHTDVVGDGDFAFWADGSDEQALIDTLEQLWAARDSLPELGRQSAAAVDQWTWEASATKLAAGLNALLIKERSH